MMTHIEGRRLPDFWGASTANQQEQIQDQEHARTFLLATTTAAVRNLASLLGTPWRELLLFARMCCDRRLATAQNSPRNLRPLPVILRFLQESCPAK